MPRILGIDPGSRVMGYAVVHATDERVPRLSYVECGVLVADAKASLDRRLGEIARGLTDVIAELRPDVAAVEDVFHAHNARSALALGQSRGAALAVCGMAGVPVHGYAPALVKKTVTGGGRASKEQVQHMVCALLGLKRLPRTDAADALAVAVAHAHIRRDRPLAVRAA
jgi:crossover junction endodeoxyribonuclease RuvC